VGLSIACGETCTRKYTGLSFAPGERDNEGRLHQYKSSVYCIVKMKKEFGHCSVCNSNSICY
jgi:hypothetical protein